MTTGMKPKTFAEFVEVRGRTRSLLSHRTAIETKLLAIGLSVNRVTTQSEPSEKFPSIPDVEIDFDIDESVPPIKQAYVRIPLHFRKAANQGKITRPDDFRGTERYVQI